MINTSSQQETEALECLMVALAEFESFEEYLEAIVLLKQKEETNESINRL